MKPKVFRVRSVSGRFWVCTVTLNLQPSSITMELLLLVFFCLLTGSEVTFGDDGDPFKDGAAAKEELIRGTTVIRVTEGSDVTLPCLLNTEDITNKKFEWRKDGRQVFLYDAGDHSNNANTGQDQLFKGRVSYFPDELKSGNASIIIRNTKVADSEKYTCNFPNHPGEIFLVVLFVERTILDKATLAEIKDAVEAAARDLAAVKEQTGSASGLVAGSVLKLFLLMVFLVLLF